MSDGVIVALISAAGAVAAAIIGLLFQRSRTPRTQDKNGQKSKAPAPIRAFELSGRWHGEQKWVGWAYDCTIRLQVVQSQIKGYINWTLSQLPPDSTPTLVKHIGETGVEHVNGFLEGDRITLSGHLVDKPKMLTLCDYSLTFREDLKTFEGTTKDQQDGTSGSLHGHALVSR